MKSHPKSHVKPHVNVTKTHVKSCVEGADLESITEESVKTGEDREIVKFLKGLNKEQMMQFHAVIQGEEGEEGIGEQEQVSRFKRIFGVGESKGKEEYEVKLSKVSSDRNKVPHSHVAKSEERSGIEEERKDQRRFEKRKSMMYNQLQVPLFNNIQQNQIQVQLSSKDSSQSLFSQNQYAPSVGSEQVRLFSTRQKSTHKHKKHRARLLTDSQNDTIKEDSFTESSGSITEPDNSTIEEEKSMTQIESQSKRSEMKSFDEKKYKEYASPQTTESTGKGAKKSQNVSPIPFGVAKDRNTRIKMEKLLLPPLNGLDEVNIEDFDVVLPLKELPNLNREDSEESSNIFPPQSQLIEDQQEETGQCSRPEVSQKAYSINFSKIP